MLARSHPIASIGSSFLTYPGGRSFSSLGSGCSFLQYPQWAPLPDFEVSSDASGALGYGAVFQGHWFSGAWLPTQVSQSIEYKELFPIVVAAYLWGPRWASKRVNFLLDNHSVVEILRSGTSRAPTIMSLVRYPGCLGTSVVRGQGYPPPFFSLSDLAASARRVLSDWNGAHGWVAGVCQQWGQFFCPGAGWPQWKPLGIPGTHLPLKRGSWLNLVKCNLTKF